MSVASTWSKMESVSTRPCLALDWHCSASADSELELLDSRSRLRILVDGVVGIPAESALRRLDGEGGNVWLPRVWLTEPDEEDSSRDTGLRSQQCAPVSAQDAPLLVDDKEVMDWRPAVAIGAADETGNSSLDAESTEADVVSLAVGRWTASDKLSIPVTILKM